MTTRSLIKPAAEWHIGTVTRLPLHPLPSWIARGIGRVVSEHAILDAALSGLLYDLLGVNRQVGRLAVRDPRSTDKFHTILEVADLKGVELSFEVGSLRKRLAQVLTHRDQLAHGIWILNDETRCPLLVITKGSWLPVPGRNSQNRIIYPEAVEIDSETFWVIYEEIRILRETIMAETNRLAALHPTLHRKSLRPLHPKSGRPKAKRAK